MSEEKVLHIRKRESNIDLCESRWYLLPHMNYQRNWKNQRLSLHSNFKEFNSVTIVEMDECFV